MELDFWKARWREGQTGFHMGVPNPSLLQYWAKVTGNRKGRVLVPLCGKSLDMLWLCEQGYDVVGVELSPVACEAFFVKDGFTKTVEDSHEIYKGHGPLKCVTIIGGDLFTLTSKTVGQIDFVYDRAAVIALPPEMRKEYAKQICLLAKGATAGLAITLEYPQSEKSGTPFSVPVQELTGLYGAGFDVGLLESTDLSSTQVNRWGCTSLQQHVCSLTSTSNG